MMLEDCFFCDSKEFFEPEPVRGQLEIPFDLEDTHRVYGLTPTPLQVDLATRYGVRVIKEWKE